MYWNLCLIYVILSFIENTEENIYLCKKTQNKQKQANKQKTPSIINHVVKLVDKADTQTNIFLSDMTLQGAKHCLPVVEGKDQSFIFQYINMR